VRPAFTWESVRAELATRGGLNIAYHALDRHLAEGRGEQLALRWLGKNGERREITYRELFWLSCRFANLLQGLGVGRGDRVFSLVGRVPELYVAALGTLRNGSVFSPLFSAFGPEPVRTRMAIGDAKTTGLCDFVKASCLIAHPSGPGLPWKGPAMTARFISCGAMARLLSGSEPR
jgi:acetyl-CoA synthetase